MKDYHKENKLYWIKENNQIIIKERLINRSIALAIILVIAPFLIMGIISLILSICTSGINIDLDKYKNMNYGKLIAIIGFTIELLMFYIVFPAIALISFFYVPNKIIFSKKNIILFRFPILKLFKKNITKKDIESFQFSEIIHYKKAQCVGYKMKSWDFMLYYMKGNEFKKIKILSIKSDIIPNYYQELKNELDILYK